MTDDNSIMVPWTALPETLLRRVVEEFVTREGTEYGTREYTIEEKVFHVYEELKDGRAQIWYDEGSGSCNILPAKK